MTFDVFQKQRQPATTEPAVTIQKRGAFSLNAPAYAMLGSPKAVELLYDRAESLVGIRPALLESANAYPVRQVTKGSSSYLVTGTAFANYYGIKLGVARRWLGRIRDGMLVIDLKEPGVVVTSNRPAGRQGQASERSPNGARSAHPHPDRDDPSASPSAAGLGREVP
ncbi:MAG TPA: hypothetical protein VK721_09835 [Solirubrobacteraceae bacterium]|nr:hypothetical protein [Solirubrobacteraceae bacterium]